MIKDDLIRLRHKVAQVQEGNSALLEEIEDPFTRRVLDIFNARLTVLESEMITELERKLK